MRDGASVSIDPRSVAVLNGSERPRVGHSRFLRNIARQITYARDAIEQEEGTAPPVVLTSDHGMALGPLAYVSCTTVRETLKAGGFVPAGSGPDGFSKS